jgi:hypothetical protein|tara:strand:- start:10375 stop:10644 length:270 start_codon:yes stop_codon:yes gene_type:complete
MSEIKLNQEINKGQISETILENEVFKEAVSAIKADYMNQLISTSYKDSDSRTAIWIAYHQLDKIIGHLTELMNTGKLASKQLEDIKTLK